MRNYNIIHKTGSIKHIATPPDEDRAMDMCYQHKNRYTIDV